MLAKKLQDLLIGEVNEANLTLEGAMEVTKGYGVISLQNASMFPSRGCIGLNFCMNYAICRGGCIPKNAEMEVKQPLKSFIDSDASKSINEWYEK